MEKKSYTYGSKLAGMILHLFFTVILTIAVYLLASLISKNILQVTDIGTDDFFNSGYYTKCMEQKCSELTDYLHLLQKGNKRSAEDDKRYLQYTNEFKTPISVTGINRMGCGIPISRIRWKARSLIHRLFSWRQRPWGII
mgnify:CR=1 FL=1